MNNQGDSVLRGRTGRLGRAALLGGVSTMVMGALAPAAFAQDEDVIVVTGIRGSLENAMNVKRNSSGVVDAITAEDIGKFPDTNLAESLQRITGVSINRVNGEGSLITARGFGSEFNLVTLNGRQMPTADITTVGGGDGADFATGTSRSFDFSNLASEGVRRLEVYKTGRANIPTGGIGATVNVVTARPLETDGLQATLGAKAVHDTTTEFGNKVTPELTALMSWSDDQKRFGISLFGSYQRRDSGSAGATSNSWNVMTGEEFLNSTGTLLRSTATVNNPPAGDQLVTFPNDSRYIYAEDERERINGLATIQFAPTDNFTVTVDGFYGQNKQTTQRAEQTNWFNRPFDEITFAGDPVPTSVYIFENIGGSADDADPVSQSVKDMGFENQYRSSKETLWSIGGNIDWQLTENLSVNIDAHRGRAFSGPNSRNGSTSTLVSFGAPVIAAHSLEIVDSFPIQRYTLNDCSVSVDDNDTPNDPSDDIHTPRGNCNNMLDVGDLGSQIARTNSAEQENTITEARLGVNYEFAQNTFVEVGFDYRKMQMSRYRTQTQQTLGNWGIENPGDVAEFAPGIVEEYCLSCQFNSFTPGDADVAFRANALDLYDALSTAYAGLGNTVDTTNIDDNLAEEEIWAIYGQIGWEGEFANMPANLLLGMRYEDTSVNAATTTTVPQAIVWGSDNDFVRVLSNETRELTDSGSYNNLLPSIDFSLEFMPDVIARASYSETIGRADYGTLFVADNPNNPPRPTALGGEATGTRGNTGILPLQSKNLDLSLEWYFDTSSYAAVTFFHKRVANFLGTGVFPMTMFDLRDATSGAEGTRSGQALEIIESMGLDRSDVNLFTLTALIDQFGVTEGRAQFEAALVPNADPDVPAELPQSYVDTILAAYDVTPNEDDPFFTFAVQQPINNREGKIHGLEFAFQHFFGDSGFGVQANYTYVTGDVKAELDSDPAVDQFALLGLSDTANASLIYENYGLSARASFNWRDQFLAATNQNGSNRNPLFVEPFKTVDVNVTYDITDNLQASFEGINLLGEDLITTMRSEHAFRQVQDLGPRFLFGLRYRL